MNKARQNNKDHRRRGGKASFQGGAAFFQKAKRGAGLWRQLAAACPAMASRHPFSNPSSLVWLQPRRALRQLLHVFSQPRLHPGGHFFPQSAAAGQDQPGPGPLSPPRSGQDADELNAHVFLKASSAYSLTSPSPRHGSGQVGFPLSGAAAHPALRPKKTRRGRERRGETSRAESRGRWRDDKDRQYAITDSLSLVTSPRPSPSPDD